MSSDFAAAAEAIADELVRDAIWHERCCCWVGAESDAKDPWRVEYRALGPDLYAGTAGIGLFLAHAGRRTAAIGALRHAVTYAGAGGGLHTGALGIACAAVAAGTLRGEEELVLAGRALGRAAPAPGSRADVAEGAAGFVLGQLALGSVDLAVRGGEALLASAARDAHGWAWRTQGSVRPLCGLAHGAAGIGWALLELYAATGDNRFRVAGEGAFAYEQSWLDTERGEWPDHRVPGYRRGRPHLVASAVRGTWCRGEAGALLTRLRAAELLGQEVDGLAAALATTRRHVSDTLEHELTDASLCHGLAGSADALLCAGDNEPARALGDALLERRDWPCAAADAVIPGLFRGRAGIGWFLLRLHDSGIPSPLMLPQPFDKASHLA